MPNETKPGWGERLYEELRKLFWIVLYLFVLLIVMQLHRAIILTDNGIGYNFHEGLVFALVNALVLGKFMLIAEALHAGQRTEKGKLIYTIILKAFIFAAILVACHILEEGLVKMWHTRSWPHTLSGLTTTNLVEILATGLMAFVALIPFFAFRELARVLGSKELRELLFRKGTAN